MILPASFFAKAITHRGLPNLDEGRAENSMAAFEAAIAHGYGIALDLQLSKDGAAMAFHDYDLGRLTDEKGAVAQRTSKELGAIPLKGDGGMIPTFGEVLAFVAGRVPLLIEIKDQDGIMGPKVGPLEDATAKALEAYDGDAAVMSFNPHSIGHLHRIGLDRPLGLVTSAYTAEGWPTIPAKWRDELRDIPDFDAVGASFISHEAEDLSRPRVSTLKTAGAKVFCWTIKSAKAEAEARKVADNVTFEGYLA